MNPEHTVAVMDDMYGREMLVAAVWGSVKRREANLRAVDGTHQSLVTLTSVGGAIGALGTWLLLSAPGILPLVGGVASGTLFWSCGSRILARKSTEYPIGAASSPHAAASRAVYRGAVEGSLSLQSPASATSCIAYALELHFEGFWGDRLMYRDAVTAGFDVELDSGRIARIPPGRIRWAGPMRQEIDIDNRGLESYIDGFDPRHSSDDRFDPLRYNVVCEQIIVPGDRVELVGDLEPVVNGRALATHYREPAPSLLTPRGVPSMRLLGADL